MGQNTVSAQLTGVTGASAPVKNNPALAGAVRPGGPSRKPIGETGNKDTAITQEPAQNKSNRVKYSCSSCSKVSVWGKPNLNIICDDCGGNFIARN